MSLRYSTPEFFRRHCTAERRKGGQGRRDGGRTYWKMLRRDNNQIILTCLSTSIAFMSLQQTFIALQEHKSAGLEVFFLNVYVSNQCKKEEEQEPGCQGPIILVSILPDGAECLVLEVVRKVSSTKEISP